MAPNTRRPPGRPKKKCVWGAADELDEDGNIRVRQIQHCGRCHETGHSKRTYHEPI